MNTHTCPLTGTVPPTAATAAATMRAIVQERYGSSDAWQLTETDRPEIEPHEVLVRVHAAGLDRGTWHAMTGRPDLMRIMGFGLRAPKHRVPGLAAVGANVSRFAVGDEVFGVSRGAFAEYAAAREGKLAPKPSGLTFEQAAAVPISATTALQGLRLGRIEAGQKVLIIGVSGGVGAYAVQLAKAYSADVTGVCSAAKADLVRSLGAVRTIDYATDGSSRYDLILDIAGNTRSDDSDAPSNRQAPSSSSAAKARATLPAASEGAYGHPSCRCSCVRR
ncbi:MAG: NAD(P)-dependent alcohol dehydrogenase [Ilumatobacteraceae bacterium]